MPYSTHPYDSTASYGDAADGPKAFKRDTAKRYSSYDVKLLTELNC